MKVTSIRLGCSYSDGRSAKYIVSKGGTDAGAAHTANEGIPSTVIGVCGRYIHTHQTMFSIADFDAAREMLIQVLKGLDESTIKTIIEGK